METLGSIFSPLTNLTSGTLELLHGLGAPWWPAVTLGLVAAALFTPVAWMWARKTARG